MLRPILVVLCLAAGPAAAAGDCHMPDAPTVPDGASASDDEMLRARDEVAGYVEAGNAFIVCLTKLRDAAEASTPPAQIAEWTKQHNDAVDRMNDVAARFNAQLKVWKAR
jgi:hypothetical protein